MSTQIIRIRHGRKLKKGRLFYGQVIYVDRDSIIDDFCRWRVTRRGEIADIILEEFFTENGAIDCCYDFRPGVQSNIYRVHVVREYIYSKTDTKWQHLKQE